MPLCHSQPGPGPGPGIGLTAAGLYQTGPAFHLLPTSFESSGSAFTLTPSSFVVPDTTTTTPVTTPTSPATRNTNAAADLQDMASKAERTFLGSHAAAAPLQHSLARTGGGRAKENRHPARMGTRRPPSAIPDTAIFSLPDSISVPVFNFCQSQQKPQQQPHRSTTTLQPTKAALTPTKIALLPAKTTLSSTTTAPKPATNRAPLMDDSAAAERLARATDSLTKAISGLALDCDPLAPSSGSPTLTQSAGSAGSSSSYYDEDLATHLDLLTRQTDHEELNEIQTAPLFTESVRRYGTNLAASSDIAPPSAPFSQYGLLAGALSGRRAGGGGSKNRPDAAAQTTRADDPRIFYNVSAPSSIFICGSQGSGKSHSLACLLENCLIPSRANQLPRPLTGIVFHYDTFFSDRAGAPCEAAYLSSHKDISVRVLCAPSSYRSIRRIYGQLSRVTVQELRLNESELNTKRMLDLMALTNANPPLYAHVLKRVLRDLRLDQQRYDGRDFDYGEFKSRLELENLTEFQLGPLKQRLETLESFMVKEQALAYDMFARTAATGGGSGPAAGRRPAAPAAPPKYVRKQKATAGTDWTPTAGQLTIVDLSCPCITAEMACSLFNICLSLFLEQNMSTGRVVALDEAHKYMNDSAECQILTDSLLAVIRLQRHIAARIFISTQEPTVSPKLLDLCSITIVHRFTSPDWLAALKKHLAGVSAASKLMRKIEDGSGKREDADTGAIMPIRFTSDDPAAELFSRIVRLRVGEALLFAPSAIIGIDTAEDWDEDEVDDGYVDEQEAGAGAGRGRPRQLGQGALKVRIRNRITKDGGRSVMAG